jgi:plasmid segregation protein ParM
LSNTLCIPAVGIDLGHGNVKIAHAASSKAPVSVMAFHAIAAPLATGSVRHYEGGGAQSGGVVIEVDNLAFLVGPAALGQLKSNAPKSAQDGYSRSREYRALMLGALSFVLQRSGAKDGQDVDIMCLSLGLPLTTYYAERGSLRTAWIGDFAVPVENGTARLKICDVSVHAQPLGALLLHAEQSLAIEDKEERQRAVDALNEMHTLVLDVGGGTLDYITTAGGVKINGERSGANTNAMDKCTRAVAQRYAGARLANWLENPHILSRISEGIAKGGTLNLPGGQRVERHEYWQLVEELARNGLDEALNQVGDIFDIELVLLVGGGGSIYAEEFKARFPDMKERVRVERDPLYTNVRGFHIVAGRKARSLMRSLGRSDVLEVA